MQFELQVLQYYEISIGTTLLDSSDQPSPSLLPPLVVYGNIMVMRRGRLFRGLCSNVESLNNVNMHLPTAILLHLERER